MLPGVTVIYGLNKVSKTSQNGNAAGKSYLTSSPADILYEEPIIGERKDKVKAGKRTLSLTNWEGKQVKIIREAKGKSDALRFIVGGKEVVPRKAADQKSYLQKVFPLTQDEYITYGHIDARKPHPLVMGSSAERKAFFTSFFNINRLDAERKIFQAELNGLKKVRASYAELLNVYEAHKKDLLSEEQVKDIERRIRKLRKKHRRLLASQREASQYSRIAAFLDSADKDLPDFLMLFENDKPELTEWKRLIRLAKLDLQDDEKRHEQAQRYADYRKANKAYENVFAELSDFTVKLLYVAGKGKPDREKALTKTKAEEAKYRAAESELKQLLAERADIYEIKKPKKVERPEGQEEGDIETLVRAFEHQLKHAQKFKEGRCEHCGSIVKVKDPKKLKRKIQELHDQLDHWAAYRKYKVKSKKWKQSRERLAELDKRIPQLRDAVIKGKILAKAHSELVNLPDVPEEFKGTKWLIEDTTKALQMDRDKIALLRKYKNAIPLLNEFASLSKKEQRRITELKKEGAFNSDLDELNNIQQRIANLESKLRLQETIKDRCLELKKRLKKLKLKLKNEKALKTLVEAYSDKAIKKMAIEAISDKLMKLVNQYARIVFPEDYRFTFDWTGTNVSLKVHRRYGKRVDVSDVRKLSGAESKLFTIVLVLSLLSFVPKKKRLNMIVLDEPTANFSRETTEAFTRLLPYLNKVIPSVIIVTPDSEERYHGAHEFTVVKVDGVASLRKGHPSQVSV